MAQAEAIIDAGVQSFMHWVDQRGSVPLIQQLNAQADDWRAPRSRAPASCSPRARTSTRVLEALSNGLTQKMLHGALAELHAADGEHRAQLAQTVSRLFLRQSTRLPSDDQR